MFSSFVILSFFLTVNGQVPLSFTQCGGNWQCRNIDNLAHLVYTCEKSTDLKVELERLMKDFRTAADPVVSITISDCRTLSLNMSLSSGQKLKYLKVQKIQNLEIKANVSSGLSHPSGIVFQDIANIPVLPAGAISSPHVKDITFERLNVGTIESVAIANIGGLINSIVWNNVTVAEMYVEALVLTLRPDAVFRMTSCHLPLMADSTWLQQGGSIDISRSSFKHLHPSSIAADVGYFNFSHNTVGETEKLAIVSPEIIFTDNQFGTVTSSFPFAWSQLIDRKKPISNLRVLLHHNAITFFVHVYEYQSENCTLEEDFSGSDMNCSIRIHHFLEGEHKCKYGDGVFVKAHCGDTCSVVKCANNAAGFQQLAGATIISYCLVTVLHLWSHSSV